MKWLFWMIAGLASLSAARAADMTALRYIDRDPGAEAGFVTRMLLTPNFLRIDNGEDGADFVLLDRRRREVINVMRANQMALIFKPGQLPARPSDWNAQLETEPTQRGTRFKLSVDGVLCSEGVAARQATPDAARAMAELKTILAAMQYRVWQESPPSLQHACDLANQVWNADSTLKLGLPLEEHEHTGRSRTFESESRMKLDPALFRVPQGMPRINAPS